MTITVEAIYVNGAFQPTQPVALPEGTQVKLTVRADKEAADPFEAVIGSCDGPEDGAASHDRYLYGDGHP